MILVKDKKGIKIIIIHFLKKKIIQKGTKKNCIKINKLSQIFVSLIQFSIENLKPKTYH